MHKLGGLFVLAVLVEYGLDGGLLALYPPIWGRPIIAFLVAYLCLVIDAGREILGLDFEILTLTVQLRNIVCGQSRKGQQLVSCGGCYGCNVLMFLC